MRATSWLFGRVGLRVRYWPGLILIKGFFARESADRNAQLCRSVRSLRICGSIRMGEIDRVIFVLRLLGGLIDFEIAGYCIRPCSIPESSPRF